MLQDAAQPFNVPEETLSKDSEGTKIPIIVPPAIKAQIFPPEKLFVSAFIDFCLPPRASAGSDPNQYFHMLAPDTFATPTVSDALRTLPLPPHRVIQQLSSQATHAWQNGSRSVVYAHANDSRRFPFWLLPFWRAISELHTIQMGWRTAQQFLSPLTPHYHEATIFSTHMSRLAWADRVEVGGLGDWTQVQDLRQFASREWLNGSNLNLMLGVMFKRFTAMDAAIEHRYNIQNTYFCPRLRAMFADQANYSESRKESVVRDAGTRLADTPHTMCFLAHVRGNHWTAFAIDSGNLQIHYGDSLQAPVPADLKSAIEWWLSNHFSLPFTWSSLEICEQSDSYSCGLLAANALMHYINPTAHQLLEPHPAALDVARLRWGNMIISAQALPYGEDQDRSSPPNPLLSLPPSRAVSPEVPQQSLQDTLPKTQRNSDPPVSEPPKKRQKTLRELAFSSDLRTSTASNKEQDTVPNDDEDTEEGFSGTLVDVLPSNKRLSVGLGNAVGRPRTSLLDKVTRRCHPANNPKKLRYRCVGDNCPYSLASPLNRKRILKHAASCHRLPSDLRREVNTLLAEESPGARLDVLEGSAQRLVEGVQTHEQSSFLRQFERYVKGVYPFEVPIEEQESPLVYWRNLTLNKDSAVLACIAEKLFSIKPNSMPEERTMSVFTRMNSAARNRQQVRALVDMTQIRQWHTYDPKHQVREYPTVSFYDLDSLLSSKPRLAEPSSKQILHHNPEGSYLIAENVDGDEELDEDDTGTWLDENEHAQTMPDICFEMEQEINLEAAVATQVLEERGPIPEKNSVEDLNTNSGVVEEGDSDYAWDW